MINVNRIFFSLSKIYQGDKKYMYIYIISDFHNIGSLPYDLMAPGTLFIYLSPFFNED